MYLCMEIVRRPEGAVVRCSGRIVLGEEVDRFHATIQQLLSESRHCVINLQGVTRIDARGLGALALLGRKARARGGRLCLVGANARVADALRVTGLAQALEIHASEEHALEVRHQAVA